MNDARDESQPTVAASGGGEPVLPTESAAGLTEGKVPRRTVAVAVIAVVVFGVLISALLVTANQTGFGATYAVIAGALVIVKEIASAFARDKGMASKENMLQNIATGCSLFAVIFAVPAVAAAI